ALATLSRNRLQTFGLPRQAPETLQVAMIASGTLCILVAITSGSTVPDYLATASWGLLAAILLLAGFAARNVMLRYAAFAIFVLAIGRIVFSDMARMDMFTRTMAALGLGVLMVLGGVVYWLLRPKNPAPNVKD